MKPTPQAYGIVQVHPGTRATVITPACTPGHAARLADEIIQCGRLPARRHTLASRISGWLRLLRRSKF